MKVFKFKSLLFGLMTVLTVAILITSCGKENLNDTEKNESEILKKENQIREYESKDAFFKSNPNISTEITYQDFIQLHVSVQKAIHENMSSHKRLLLWKQKFKIDLMSEDLPEDVRSIMSKFIHEVTKEKFTSKTGLSNLSKYLEELNEKNQKYFIQFPSNTKNTATILKSLDCKENWCIACFASAPPRSPLIAFCETGCHVTYSGCGWFWQEPCNRLCRIEFIFGGGGDGLIPTGD